MKNRSLTLRLISVLSLTALLVWFGSTLVAWWQVRHDVNKVLMHNKFSLLNGSLILI